MKGISMDYEQDYIMRMVKDMARMIAKMLLGRTTPKYTFPEEERNFSQTDWLCRKWMAMADQGQINEAENELSDYLEAGTGSGEELRAALGFYVHINEYSDDFLDEHDYSREEIYQGVEELSTRFGVTGLNIKLPG